MFFQQDAGPRRHCARDTAAGTGPPDLPFAASAL